MRINYPETAQHVMKNSSDIFQVSVGIYCNTSLKDQTETYIFQEKRQVHFYVDAFDLTNAKRLSQVNTWLNELAEEVCYLTGYGIYQITISSTQNGKKVPVVKNTYTEYPPIGSSYLFAIEFFFDQRKSLRFPYVYPQNTRFPGRKLSYGDIYPLDKIGKDKLFHTDPLFRRFVLRFDNPTPLSAYSFQDGAYYRYTNFQAFSLTALPKSCQSITRRGKQRVQKKIRELRKNQEKELQQERKRQGKPPIPEKIYVIAMNENLYKIGVSTRPNSRLRQLQTSHPHKLTLLHTFPAEPGREAEEKLHRFFHRYRLEGEWFHLDKIYTQFLSELQKYHEGQFYSTRDSSHLEQLNGL